MKSRKIMIIVASIIALLSIGAVSYTHLKVGGNAEFLAFPRNQYELKRIVQFANQEQIPWMVLGLSLIHI